MGMYLITLTRDDLSDLGIFTEMTLAEGGEVDNGNQGSCGPDLGSGIGGGGGG